MRAASASGRSRGRSRAAKAVAFGLVALTGLSAQARINVDTVPGRDSTQLTIYNSVDLTMVRETRFLVLRQGLNHLEFSWANTRIDPTSVEFKALSRGDQIEVQDVSFPPRVTNTLEWRVQSGFSGEVQVEIRYFTSGIRWEADYALKAARDEKTAGLDGYVRVSNQSGEDYENAQIRLVVGVIRLVDDIVKLAETGAAPAQIPNVKLGKDRLLKQDLAEAAFGLEVDKAEVDKKIVKEELSEYFLYTVRGRDTIPNGWAKRLPSFSAREIPLTSYYKFEKESWGDAVARFYRFKNDPESKLGREPLPNGEVKAFRSVSNDGLQAFAGQTAVKYIPINETVDLELGGDEEVLVRPALMDWQKDDLRFGQDGNVSGWTETEVWRVETQNSKEIDATLDIRRNFQGDWSVESNIAFEKVDARKIKFLIPLKPREKKVIEYKLVTRHGTNIRR